MKNRISALMIFAIMTATVSSYGQGCEIYSDYKEGTSTKTVHYDKNDKPTGYTITTVKEKQMLPDGVALLLHQKYDNNEDYNFESEFSISCINGDVIVDMGKFVDPNTMTAYQDMEFEIDADDLSIPRNASAGDKLNDGKVTVTVNTGTPIKVTLAATVTNRMVAGTEEIETPAGTFDCLKITYDLLTQVGFIKINSTAAEFYNRKHGVIRSESYNKKGKITGYTVVEEINN